jgi:hypothetical protein
MSFNGPTKVNLKRVPRPGSFGITAFGNTVTIIGCPISKNGHKTGLTKEEEDYFEKALRLKEGDLDKHSDWWDNTFNVKYPILLNNTKTTELILDNPINQLKYKVLLASSKIANSEIEKGPDTDFYIDNQEAKAKAEVEQFNYEMEGMESILKMNTDEKRNALRMFGKTGLDDTAEFMLKAELGRLLKKDAKKFVETINDKDIITKAFVQELIEKQILTRKGSDFKYGDDFIGSNIEACVLFFESGKNQETKLHLQGLLAKKKKGK